MGKRPNRKTPVIKILAIARFGSYRVTSQLETPRQTDDHCVDRQTAPADPTTLARWKTKPVMVRRVLVSYYWRADVHNN